MNHDLALIALVLENRDLTAPIKAGIKSKMLSDEAQVYWDLILDHYEKHQEVFSVEFFKSILPNYEHNPPSDSIDAVIHEVKTRYLYSEIQSHLKAVASLSNQDPWLAKDEMLKLAEGLHTELNATNTDLIAGEDKDSVLRVLEMLQHGGGLLGLPWPWEYLNENSMGLMSGNFIYLYGREKSRKTWLLLFLGLFWESLGYRVLFVSREMSLAECAWRLYPLRAKLDYQALTRGNVSTDGKITLEAAIDDLYRHKNFIITEAGGGIAGLRAKIEEIRPNIVIHDYMKAIAEDEMGDKLSAKEHIYVARVADKMKETARKFGIPIIGCGHANREGVKLRGKGTEEVAHADHIVRRADLVIRVITDDVTDKMALIVPAGRQVRKFLSWTINARLDANFGDFYSTDTSWTEESEEVTTASKKSKEENPEAEASLKQVKEGLSRFKPTRRK